jgi:hypothetical protein
MSITRIVCIFSPPSCLLQSYSRRDPVDLLVLASNPSGPTTRFNYFRGNFRFASNCKLRGGCILLRSCFDIQPIDPRDVRPGTNTLAGARHCGFKTMSVRRPWSYQSNRDVLRTRCPGDGGVFRDVNRISYALKRNPIVSKEDKQG